MKLIAKLKSKLQARSRSSENTDGNHHPDQQAMPEASSGSSNGASVTTSEANPDIPEIASIDEDPETRRDLARSKLQALLAAHSTMEHERIHHLSNRGPYTCTCSRQRSRVEIWPNGHGLDAEINNSGYDKILAILGDPTLIFVCETRLLGLNYWVVNATKHEWQEIEQLPEVAGLLGRELCPRHQNDIEPEDLSMGVYYVWGTDECWENVDVAIQTHHKLLAITCGRSRILVQAGQDSIVYWKVHLRVEDIFRVESLPAVRVVEIATPSFSGLGDEHYPVPDIIRQRVEALEEIASGRTKEILVTEFW